MLWQARRNMQISLSRQALLLPLVVAACFALACGDPASNKPARHVVLVTIDTLRADHVDPYSGRSITPTLNQMARDGAFVKRTTTHVPLTRPAHVSLFSGLLPTRTGIRDNTSPGTPPDSPMLAERLQSEGFATGAFVSAVVIGRESGLDRGFDHYDDNISIPDSSSSSQPTADQFLSAAQRAGQDTLDRALDWLNSQIASEPERQTFTWLHLYEPHDPYEAPREWQDRFPGEPYAAEVAYADDLVRQLDTRLTELGIGQELLLMVTSDHGEGLGEHDELLHGFFAYETTLAVPLIFRGPGVEPGTKLAGPAGLVDVFPTVLELLGLPNDTQVSGRSLAGELAYDTRESVSRDSLSREPQYAESLIPLLHFGWSDLRVVRGGDFKYIQAPRPELYDLANDPGEVRNLAAERPDRVADFRGVLERFLNEERAAAEGGENSLPTELLEKLGALGYVGGSGPATTPTPGADPKDRIEDFRYANDGLRQALKSLGENDFPTAERMLRGILDRGIDSADVRFYLGKALLAQADFGAAAAELRRSLDVLPSREEAWTQLATARANSEGLDRALGVLEDGAAVLPNSERILLARARALRAQGRFPEVLELLGASSSESTHPELLVMYGEALRSRRRFDEAVVQFRRATQTNPDSAMAWNALGMTLGGTGGMGAEEAFRKAVEIAPSNARYAFNLGLLLTRLGNQAEARSHFAEALRLEPGFTAAREQLDALR